MSRKFVATVGTSALTNFNKLDQAEGEIKDFLSRSRGNADSLLVLANNRDYENTRQLVADNPSTTKKLEDVVRDLNYIYEQYRKGDDNNWRLFLPAEISSTLLYLQNEPLRDGETIELWHSQTGIGYFCAYILKKIFDSAEGLPNAKLTLIEGLDLNKDYKIIADDIDKKLKSYREIDLVINITGGYKIAIPAIVNSIIKNNIDSATIIYLYETAERLLKWNPGKHTIETIGFYEAVSITP